MVISNNNSNVLIEYGKPTRLKSKNNFVNLYIISTYITIRISNIYIYKYTLIVDDSAMHATLLR